MPTPTHKPHLSIPYTSPPLPLRTLDLHTPTTPPSQPSYTIIYIHGGAFRDPLITSQSLLPSLPFLFPSASQPPPPSKPTASNSSTCEDGSERNHIAALASLNYRLTPYPTHPTHPSQSGDESRNAKWPDQVKDVRAAMRWLFASSSDNDDRVVQGRRRYPGLADGSGVILVGHSVGATIAFGVALGLGYHGDEEDGFKDLRRRIKAVVGVEGIYDFTALRDAHIEHRDVYEGFTNGAFGDEGAGEWEKGDIVKKIREGGKMDGVEVVVLGQSTEDELVDWGQIEMMGRALQEKGWRRGEDVEGAAKEVTVVELKGRHDEIWEKGEQLARCISVAVDRCVGRNLDGGC